MKSIDYTEIGHKIRQSRISHSYSQEQLAELTGISTAFLGHIERGTRAMSLETLVSLCSVFPVSYPSSPPVYSQCLASSSASTV